MTTHEFALSDLAARLLGTDASLSTSLRDILTVALQELIEAELTATIGAAPGERTTWGGVRQLGTYGLITVSDEVVQNGVAFGGLANSVNSAAGTYSG